MNTRPPAGRRSSATVQNRFALLREIREEVFILADGDHRSLRYGMVCEIEGISYDLKSEAEQIQLLDLYQAFLAGLRFPVQLLWRVLPLNLAPHLTPYRKLLTPQTPQTTESETACPENDPDLQGLWAPLAEAHLTFMEQLAATRSLLDRHIYLVIQVTEPAFSAQNLVFPGLVWPWQWKKLTRGQKEAAFEQARQELMMRFAEIQRGLAHMGLRVRRLQGITEIAPFYYSCCTPIRAQRFPLQHALLDELDRPVQRRAPLVPATIQHRTSQVSSSTRSKPLPDQHRSSASLRPFAHLTDLVAPASVVVQPDYLMVEDEYVRGLTIYQLPRRVAAGWLRQFADLDEPIEITFYLEPTDPAAAIAHLRRRRTQHHASILAAERKGREGDPHLKVASDDIERMIEQLASGEERLLDVSFFVLVRGTSLQELDERTNRVRALLHQMLLAFRVARYEQDQLYRSCLPHGTRLVRDGVLLDSESAATMFHFLARSLFHPDGTLIGVTPQDDPIILNLWELANANLFVLGAPGSGKSYMLKTFSTRLALFYVARMLSSTAGQQTKAPDQENVLPFQIIRIDPEREYVRTTLALGGQMIRLAPGSPHHVNPFDLPPVPTDSTTQHGDRLADHVQKLHTLLEIMLADRTPTGVGRLTSAEKGLLDRACYETYRRVGITSESKTHDRPAPLLRDLYDVLESGVCGPDTTGLLARLRRYVHGSLAGLFAQPTNVALDRIAMTFDLHDLESELRPVGLFLVSNFVWSQSFQSRVPRLLIVDEAATLLQYESGALFLEDLVRRARKHYLGVAVLSQHPGIFQGSSIPSNCATHILMRQEATALDLLEQMFRLSPRESQVIRRLGTGEALVLTDDKRLQVRFVRNEVEHLLATTDPRELAHWRTHPPSQHHLGPVFQQILAFDDETEPFSREEQSV